MIYSAAMLGQTYADMFVKKNPPRTSTTSGMGYMMELFNTPGECHRQLRMSPEIFFRPTQVTGSEVWVDLITAYVYY
jgi:hypothetical protein